MIVQETLVCTRCHPLELRVCDMETALRSMSDENTRLAEENADMHETRRMLESANRKLKGDLTKARGEGPNAERVELVLNCWVQGCGTARADITMTSDRASLVFKMLKHRNCGAKNANEQAQMLCRAVKGVALKPYKLFNDRHTIKPGDHRARRLTRLEHCIGTDDRIEENVAVYRNACKSATELRQSMFNLWQEASALESELCHLVTLPLALYEQGKDADDIEAFLWEKVAARDLAWEAILATPVEPVSNVVPIRTAAA